MNTFTIFEQKAPENKPAQLLIETQAYEGIKRIGARVACDIGLVAGVEPALITAPNQCENDRVVIFAPLGKRWRHRADGAAHRFRGSGRYTRYRL